MNAIIAACVIAVAACVIAVVAACVIAIVAACMITVAACVIAACVFYYRLHVALLLLHVQLLHDCAQ